MKTIIAGGRGVANPLNEIIAAVKASGFEITEVVSGRARGVDKAGETWALLNNLGVAQFPANWEKHGRAAGSMRNRKMAVYAEALIAIWDGKSPGTKNMIETAQKLGLKVYVHKVD